MSPLEKERILHPDRSHRDKSRQTVVPSDREIPLGTGIGGQPSVKEILPAQKPTKAEIELMKAQQGGQIPGAKAGARLSPAEKQKD